MAGGGGAQAVFWGRIARRYDEVVDLQLGPSTRRRIAGRLAEEPPLGHVVELGCGTGFFTRVLAERAERVVATDLSAAMLEIARERVGSSRVSFEVQDCQQTSLAPASFDTAFLALVLQFTDPPRTLGELHRILKPGGTLLIANLDPGALARLARARAMARVVLHGLLRYRTKPPRGFGRNTLRERQLHSLLGTSGFDVRSSETFRDGARASYIPVEYVRAVKRAPSQ